MIDTVMALNDDQIASQYKIIFPSGIPGDGDGTRLSLRADQSFQPPAKGVGKYEVWMQGRKVEKTNNLEETDKTFTISFRVDQLWGLYNDLNKWWQLVCNDDDGTSQNDADTRTTLIVQAVDTNKNPKHDFIYYGVKLTNIEVAEFNHSSGDPLRVTCTFIYVKQKG